LALRHSRTLIGGFKHEFRACHAERLEDVLFLELIQRLAGHDFDDAADDIGRMTVTPERARLPRQWQHGDPLGKHLVVETTVEQAGVHIGLIDQLAANVIVGDARRVPQQIHHGHRPVQRYQFQKPSSVGRSRPDAYFHIGKCRDEF